MPHKRAKRSIREQSRAERNLDLPPSQSTFTPNDVPKSMTRVLNAESVQNAWRERKRKSDAEDSVDGPGGKRKKQKTHAEATKTELKIKPGESLKHFKRRVEDDMRSVIRSAMKNTSSASKQKSKESQRDAEQRARSKKKKASNEGGSDSEEETSTRRGKKGKAEREPSPEFARVSSAAPKRLNDIVQAPPEMKSAPRLSRLVEKAKSQRVVSKNGAGKDLEDGEDGIITLQQKRMMELEREKAINRYRALKEARMKGLNKDVSCPL